VKSFLEHIANRLSPHAVPEEAAGARADPRVDVDYAGLDGQPLRGHWYAPAGSGPFPVVVAVHGGGWQVGAPDHYQHIGPWLARRGYAVLAASYRLARPGNPTWPGAVRDVCAAVQYVKANAAKLKVDRERVALLGDSAGGHLASLVALGGDGEPFAAAAAGGPPVSTAVKVVAAAYGVYDLYAQWEHDLALRPRDSIVEKFLGVSAIEDKRPYLEASPLWRVSSRASSTAFFLAWGDGDDIVDCRSQSEAFLRALKHAGHYVRTCVFPAAPHFWLVDPLEDAGSYSAVFAARLLRFLQARL